jgi:hypothetical protein
VCLPLALPLPEEEEEVEEEMEMPAVAANLTNEMLLLLLHMLYCCWSGWMDGSIRRLSSSVFGLVAFLLSSSSVESSFLLALYCSPSMDHMLICTMDLF